MSQSLMLLMVLLPIVQSQRCLYGGGDDTSITWDFPSGNACDGVFLTVPINLATNGVSIARYSKCYTLGSLHVHAAISL